MDIIMQISKLGEVIVQLTDELKSRASRCRAANDELLRAKDKHDLVLIELEKYDKGWDKFSATLGEYQEKCRRLKNDEVDAERELKRYRDCQFGSRRGSDDERFYANKAKRAEDDLALIRSRRRRLEEEMADARKKLSNYSLELEEKLRKAKRAVSEAEEQVESYTRVARQSDSALKRKRDEADALILQLKEQDPSVKAAWLDDKGKLIVERAS